MSGRKSRNYSAYGFAPAILHIFTFFKLLLYFCKNIKNGHSSELPKLECEIHFLG